MKVKIRTRKQGFYWLDDLISHSLVNLREKILLKKIEPLLKYIAIGGNTRDGFYLQQNKSLWI